MEEVLIDGIMYGLAALEKDCWLGLLNASLHYKDPLHNPVVANVSVQGVNQRTVVLRKVNTEKKQLAFHTDIRSGKWNELEISPAISWLFYNPAGKIQIRLGGIAALHHDDAVADNAWQKSTMSSRKIYLGENGPSSVAALPVSGLPAAFESSDPTAAESEAGRKNFGIVTTQINWMEWLWLNSKGHRRASFKYNSDNSFDATWLVP
jgi:pyridoxamine 5'-phosphate oxidase